MNRKRKAKKAIKLGEYYLYKKQDDIKAIYNFKRAIIYSGLYSDSEYSYKLIAKAYMYLGDFINALDYINQALQLSPYDIESIERKAKIYERMGDDSNSKIFFDQAIHLIDQVSDGDLESYLSK